MHLDEVLRQTARSAGAAASPSGHVTKLSALAAAGAGRDGAAPRDAGIAVTVLPATDLFLMGRDADHNVPRGVARADRFLQHGVTCSLATNNVLNPFTPFGDAC